MPFLYQHQVAIAFNPSWVVVGSSEPLKIEGPEVIMINSAAAVVLNEFDFKVQNILGHTNEITESSRRIYSDEPEGITKANSEHVKDIDEPINGWRQRKHPIYIDVTSISLSEKFRLLTLYRNTRSSFNLWSSIFLIFKSQITLLHLLLSHDLTNRQTNKMTIIDH